MKLWLESKVSDSYGERSFSFDGYEFLSMYPYEHPVYGKELDRVIDSIIEFFENEGFEATRHNPVHYKMLPSVYISF